MYICIYIYIYMCVCVCVCVCVYTYIHTYRAGGALGRVSRAAAVLLHTVRANSRESEAGDCELCVPARLTYAHVVVEQSAQRSVEIGRLTLDNTYSRVGSRRYSA